MRQGQRAKMYFPNLPFECYPSCIVLLRHIYLVFCQFRCDYGAHMTFFSLIAWKRLFIALALLGIMAIAALLYALHDSIMRIHRDDMTFTEGASLAIELRDTTWQLNAMAHRAVMGLGDADIEQEFLFILKIQEGQGARPATVHVAPGMSVPFKDLAQYIAYTKDELALFNAAYAAAAALAQIELQAVRVSSAGAGRMDAPSNHVSAHQVAHMITNREFIAQQQVLEQTLAELLLRLRDRQSIEGAAVQERLDVLMLGLCFALFLVLSSLILAGHLAQLPGYTAAGSSRQSYLFIALLLVIALLTPLYLIYNDARGLLITAQEKRQALICNEVYADLRQRAYQALSVGYIATAQPTLRRYVHDDASSTKVPPSRSDALEVLRTFSDSYADNSQMILLDRYGQTLASTLAIPQHWQWLTTAQMEQVLSGESFISEMPMPPDNTKELAVIVPMLVRHGRQSEVVAIIVSVLERRHSFRIWEGRLAPEERMHIFIVNKAGDVLLSSRAGIALDDTQPVYGTAAKMATEGADGLHYYSTQSGEKRMGYFRTLTDMGWTVVVSSSLDVLTAHVRNMLLRAGLFGTITIVCVLLLGSQLLLRMTTSLRLANERMANLIHNAGMFTWEVDFVAEVCRYDAQWQRILGFPDPQESQCRLAEHRASYHPDDPQNAFNELTESALGQFLVFERRHRAYNGTWRWIRVFARIEKVDTHGKPTILTGSGMDITAEKEYAATAEEQQQRLEKLVAQRTAELEAASQAKTTFLSTVSHEIRTPMNAIMGFAHVFDRSNLTIIQKSHLDKIKLSAAALLAVINDVLDISKIEANKLELEKIPFKVSGLLDTVCSIVEFAAQEKGLYLRVDIDADTPNVLMGDPQRISQVLLNLMNNAVKFTSQGGVILRVQVVDNTDDAQQVDKSVLLSISVQDTGIGLTQEQMQRLFQPFMQADSSVTRRFGGTGLGLAISRRLVELMGGTIRVDSQIGVGSTFAFSLCLERGESMDDTSHESLHSALQQENVTLRTLAGKAVLVVEDNEINQEIATVLLGEYGITPDLACNGSVALEMVLQKQYECIFMDMQMPVMDGIEASRRLRALGVDTPALAWLHTVPIIAMTANAMAEDRQRCLDAGMDDHIGKPIDPAVLRRCLLHWLFAARTSSTAV